MNTTRMVEKMTASVPLSLSRQIVRRGVLGINFHVVSDAYLPHIAPILPYKTVQMFENDLEYLAGHHDVISYREALAADPKSARPLPAEKRTGNSIILTFDDGYTECFTVIRPLLTRYGLPATFFVIASTVDNRDLVYPNKVALCIDAVRGSDDALAAERLRAISDRFGVDVPTTDSLSRWMRSLHLADVETIDEVGALLGLDWQQFLRAQRPFMTTAEIRQMAAEGFTIGAHSVRHPYLRTLDNPGSVEEEIVESCRFVRELTGQDRVPFAFPFAADALDREFLEDVVRRHDFIGLLFDMRELTRDRSFIVNRVPGDMPDARSHPQSTLPDVLRNVYQRRMMEQLHTVARATGLRRRT